MTTSVRPLLLRGMVLFLLLGLMATQVVMADPPGRVARLSHSQGEVSYSPYGTDDWVRVNRNRALWRGDRVWADRSALAELQVGNAVLRMAQATSLEILDLDDRIAQFEVTQGSVNLRVSRLYQGQVYEIATPTLAFTIDQPGRYRVDVDPRSNQTTIIVWEGGGEAWGDNSRFAVREGDAVRFNDSDLRRYALFDLPRADAFDRYCMDRDQRLDRSPSLRYVGADLIGYADLDDYGSWREVGNYGGVWFPRRVAADWAPYRDGHWVWQDPWGWTWVDDAPWGFAPSHYGRWVHVQDRWGWVPGPRTARVVYAPALVAFIGGNNWSDSRSRGNDAPVGWFPLGPREVYVPTYSASRGYFDRVNMSNTVVSRTSITTIYNNYSSGRGSIAQPRYVNRDVRGSVTAVPGSVFRNGRAVGGAALRLDANQLATGEIARRIDITPDPRSVRGTAADARAQPDAAVFDRRVLARHAAPARAEAALPPDPRDRSLADPARRGNAAPPQRDQSASDNVRQIQQRTMVDARAAPQAVDEAAVFERAQQDQQRMLERQQVEREQGEQRASERGQRAQQQQQMNEQGEQRAQQEQQQAQQRELRSQENQLREQQEQQEQAQQRIEQDRQQAAQAQQRAQREQQQAQQRELRSQQNQLREQQQQEQEQQRIEQDRQQAVQAQQRAQQEQQRVQEREQRNAQEQRRESEPQVRPQQPQIEPPATGAVPEPRQGTSRRNKAPADPDAEDSESKKAEREKAEREKAEREKAEREKAEREKAEREKRDGKRDD